MKKPTSKYRNKTVVVDGIKFASKAESEYYKHLLRKVNDGEIVDFELQPKFLLQEGFKKNGKTFYPIHYKADFMIIHNDGSYEVVDIKGQKITTDFSIKRKMFELKFPKLSLTLLKKTKTGFDFHEQN